MKAQIQTMTHPRTTSRPDSTTLTSLRNIDVVSPTRLWESVQVELQGRYSLQRFHELIAHAKISTATGNVATLLFTPLPALFWLILNDSFPLEPPDRGLSHQTLWLYLRLVLMSCLSSLSIVVQVRACVPALPLSASRLLVLIVIPALASAFSLWAQAVLWTFPTPVGLLLLEPWFILSTALCSLWLWRGTLHNDPDTKIKFFRFLKVIVVHYALGGAYVSYYAVFSVVGTAYQAYLSVLLPIIKLTFKNMARSGLYFAEDLVPSAIVMNIDVFHMMFVCRTMQQTRGGGSVVFIMAVDVVQSIVAYYEVYKIVRQVNALAKASIPADTAVTADDLTLKLDGINSALYLVNTNPRIRYHPTIPLPRHIQQQIASLTSVGTTPATGAVSDSAPARIYPLETSSPGQLVVQTQGSPNYPVSSGVSDLSQLEQAQLKCVAGVLKLLHMTEFYILIEFVEVGIATVFALYVLTISHMFNRVYYFQLSGQSDEDLYVMVQQLALYAALELISFVALCVMLNHHLRHLSTVQQLAFVLQKHWAIVVPTMTFGVFLNVLLTLEHFGMDFTFRFKWLEST